MAAPAFRVVGDKERGAAAIHPLWVMPADAVSSVGPTFYDGAVGVTSRPRQRDQQLRRRRRGIAWDAAKAYSRWPGPVSGQFTPGMGNANSKARFLAATRAL